MRSRSTNVLQMIVMITGLVYIAFGALFFISPVTVGKIFAVYLNTEWGVNNYDAFIVLIYLVARGFSPLIIISGLSLVMPLYDPLKYRLMIYLFGAVFPVISGTYLIITGFLDKFITAYILGGGFLILFVLNLSALFLTKENARKGIE
jgi:hypothetical protein